MRTLADQITYGNEDCRSVLILMYKMNNDVFPLQKEVDDAQGEQMVSITEFTEMKNTSIKALTEMMAALTETTKALTKEVNMLRPLGENAIEMGKRFFATYHSQKHQRKHDNRTRILAEILLPMVAMEVWMVDFLRTG